ncbi:MAG: 2-(acetamidomethylene)succinate hydrolase [Alphaproteobacteria bacterium MarineAlpha2_Bin1]|nr:MAG: 2-(acetamidomethylene)succinate hydrolase [Alphaproteobacteria bacterium MarineAlpha2_Bin1]
MEKTIKTPESKRITIDNLSIHYLDWGGEDPPIILLHPNRTNSRVWDFVVNESCLKNRFIAWDARGHGLSDYPEDGYLISNYLEDLEIFCNKLSLKNIILVGAATGGNIAILFASKFQNLVKALVVADPGLSLDKKISNKVQMEIMNSFQFESMEVARNSMPFSELWSDEMKDHYSKYSFELLENNQYQWLYYPPGVKITESELEREIWDQIAIKCPTLILRGERSDVFPEINSKKLSDMIDISHEKTISDCNHRLSQDQPRKMAYEIDLFIKKYYQFME